MHRCLHIMIIEEMKFSFFLLVEAAGSFLLDSSFFSFLLFLFSFLFSFFFLFFFLERGS